MHADNRKKDILVLGEGTTDGLDITAATVKDKYSVNITTSRKKICLKMSTLQCRKRFFIWCKKS